MNRYVLYSLDLEEFDFPLKQGAMLEPRLQMEISARGLAVVSGLLDRRNIRATLFSTLTFAEAYPETVLELSRRHEIASHGCNHVSFADADLERSRLALSQLIKAPVTGFRAPRMGAADPGKLADAGYRYDASLNPTWLPGRYNNFFKPRRIHDQGKIVEIPASVTPILRIPLFWFTFKALPLNLMVALALWTLRHDGVLSLYFHPWEFADLEALPLPGLIRTVSGERMADKTARYLKKLSAEADFVSYNDYLNIREAGR